MWFYWPGSFLARSNDFLEFYCHHEIGRKQTSSESLLLAKKRFGTCFSLLHVKLMAAGCSLILSIDMLAKMFILIFMYAVNPNLLVKKKK